MKKALRPVRYLVLATLVLLPALPAHAHLVVTGFGPLVDTLVHMLVGPDAVMVAAAAGFLAALRGEQTQKAGRWMFLYGWLLFYIAALFTDYPFDFPIPAAITLGVMGLLVASDLALPPVAVYVMLGWTSGLYGLIAGACAQGVEMKLVTVMSSIDFCLLWAAYAGAHWFTLRFPRARIAVRVAGSWIMAIGMLQLGWAIRMRGVVVPAPIVAQPPAP